MPRLLRILTVLALVLIVRATSPPSAAAGVAWARPVPGGVVRPFAYDPAEPFVPGGHRGADLAAAPGATVRAACGGRVVTARAGQVVTLRCGSWRVTHLPMARVTVHLGRRVAAGARLGTLGASAEHRGLHLGVRAAGDRFAYVDPLPFLPRAGRPHLTPRLPATRARRRLRVPPLAAPLARGVRVPSGGGAAPWPAWAGLALVLCGALGGGVKWRVRARRVTALARAREGVA